MEPSAVAAVARTKTLPSERSVAASAAAAAVPTRALFSPRAIAANLRVDALLPELLNTVVSVGSASSVGAATSPNAAARRRYASQMTPF